MSAGTAPPREQSAWRAWRRRAWPRGSAHSSVLRQRCMEPPPPSPPSPPQQQPEATLPASLRHEDLEQLKSLVRSRCMESHARATMSSPPPSAPTAELSAFVGAVQSQQTLEHATRLALERRVFGMVAPAGSNGPSRAGWRQLAQAALGLPRGGACAVRAADEGRPDARGVAQCSE